MKANLLKNIFKANPLIILAYSAGMFALGVLTGAILF